MFQFQLPQEGWGENSHRDSLSGNPKKCFTMKDMECNLSCCNEDFESNLYSPQVNIFFQIITVVLSLSKIYF